ncbi:hypothetical protein SDC9_144513 [bioreactor metagenome]|uniref:Uncharacterized protein n=1 Tax=bioreactor metagenome TaxID=1076179 RepID=A0A645E6B8_9ZZZZ
MTRVWRLCAIELPECDGIYEVRLSKRNDLLSPEIETIMEFKNGDWYLRVPEWINEYKVHAWRQR